MKNQKEMLFNLKTIIPETSELRELTEGARNGEEFLIHLLKRKKTTELHSILDETQRYKAKVGTISDHLILRNSHTIIEQAQVMRDLLNKNSSSEVHFETATEKIEALKEGFLDPHLKMEENVDRLASIYETRRLATRYQKFLELKTQLVDAVSKPFEVEKASELYKKCIDALDVEQFQGLKFFDESREQIENSKTLISADCTTRLTKALDELSFTESKIYLFAFDNMQLMQLKIQEIANKAMRDNFALIKEMFTDNLELDSKDLKGSLEGFFPRIHDTFSKIIKQSQRIWILEVSFYERMRSIKEKDLISLFILYYGKLINMIVQTFQKLVENKAKLPVNYEVIFLSSPIFMKSLVDLVHKLSLFIIAHPTGYHQNYITFESLQEVTNKELPSIIEKEFEVVFLDKLEELAEVRSTLLEEIQSTNCLGFQEGSIDELDNYFRLISLLLQNYPQKIQPYSVHLLAWFQEIFDSVVSIIKSDQLGKGEESSDPAQSSEVAEFLRLFKTFFLLSHLSGHLSTLVLTINEAEVPPAIEDILNQLSTMQASVGKRLVQAAASPQLLSQTSILDEVCSEGCFVRTLTSLVDCRSWSAEEIWVIQNLFIHKVMMHQESGEKRPSKSWIDSSVCQEFIKVIESFEPDGEEVYLVNQLRTLAG